MIESRVERRAGLARSRAANARYSTVAGANVTSPTGGGQVTQERCWCTGIHPHESEGIREGAFSRAWFGGRATQSAVGGHLPGPPLPSPRCNATKTGGRYRCGRCGSDLASSADPGRRSHEPFAHVALWSFWCAHSSSRSGWGGRLGAYPRGRMRRDLRDDGLEHGPKRPPAQPARVSLS